ncbi:MAG: hypothetical protein M0C28_32360 [Candidatus Moduliflexus flocculans]|nr:hypothetical protein [Candidatus Moduliflexus flocculans]
MNNEILSLEDLALKAGVPGRAPRPNGPRPSSSSRTASRTRRRPCSPRGGLDRVAHIQRLADLGYGTEEIAKIVKKVGLPREDRGRKKGAEKVQVPHGREPGRALRRQPADDQALGGQGHHRARHADGRRLPALPGILRLPLPAHPRPPALRLHARGDQGRLGRRPDLRGHRGRARTPSRQPRSKSALAAMLAGDRGPLRQDEAPRGGRRALGGPAQEEEEGHPGPPGQEQERGQRRPRSEDHA